jgi:hypothetical protein
MKYFEINLNILYNAVQACGKKSPNKFLGMAFFYLILRLKVAIPFCSKLDSIA